MMTEAAAPDMFFDMALLPRGWASDVRITTRHGRFLTVTAGVMPEPGDERHALGLPGMANLHSHAFQRGMAGLAERRGPANDSFWTWRNIMYRFVDRLTPDQLRAIAALAYVEMLETGFTRVGEFHYLHHDPNGMPYADPAETSAAIVAAADASGIGLTLLPVFYAHSGFGGQAAGAGQRRFLHGIDGFARLVDAAGGAASALPDALVGIAPHSLRAVTPDELAAILPLGEGPVHIHIAEQQREVADCLAWSGARPVQWLLDHASVDARWCLVHATHVDEAELDGIVGTGAVAGLCPITEANLGDGIFPAGRFMASGGRYGVGSDSNVLIDMTEELRLLEYGQRLSRQHRNILARAAGGSTGLGLFEASVAGGAQALGVDGGIAPGLSADLFSIAMTHPSLCAIDADQALDALVFAAGRTAMDCVWRHGAKVVENGRHRHRDAVVADYRLALRQLRDA